VRVGCEIVMDVPAPVAIVTQVQPRIDGVLGFLREEAQLQPTARTSEYLDGFGNRCWRMLAPAGEFTLRYDAEVETSSEPDSVHVSARQIPVEDLPSETLVFTMPSRYVLSDLLGAAAWDLFGSTPQGWARVQAVCDWVYTNIQYRPVSTTPSTTSLDVYLQRYGVCHDFAHMGVTMCRALNIPARYVCGYLPDIGVTVDTPMDFHSWFEAYLDGQWYAFDARHNVPRIGRIPVGRGRDALDVAIVTQYGAGTMSRMTVWADQTSNPTQSVNAHDTSRA